MKEQDIHFISFSRFGLNIIDVTSKELPKIGYKPLILGGNHLMHNDLVFIHINATDEESRNKNVKGKIDIIERIDREIVEPILEFLDRKFPDKYRIAIVIDHYTLLKDGTHVDKPVPYAIYGEGII